MEVNTGTELDAPAEEIVVLDEGAQQAPEKPKSKFSEDDKREFTSKVNKRIGELTGKYRQEQARAEALARQLAEYQKATLAQNDEALKRDQENAKQRHQRAFAEGDAQAVTEAADELARIHAQRSDVQRQAQQVRVPQQQAVTPQYTEKTQAYIDANPWFDADPGAKQLALTTHAIAEAKGLRPDTPAYFDFITKAVKSVFPEHFDDEEPEEEEPVVVKAAPVAPVAPARRSVPGTPQRAKLPPLTADEASMARKLGITLEDYAREKLKIQLAGKK